MKSIIFPVIMLMSLAASATEISFTIDDPGVQQTSRMKHPEVATKILEALKAHDVKAILFVCGMRVDQAEGKDILSQWNEAGHILANHTYSHKNFNNPQMSVEDFVQDMVKNENHITSFSHFKKILRFPMLKEGNSVEKRDGIRKVMKDRGYSQGHVTIDASDWYISDRFVNKLNKGEKVDFEAYKKYFLDHIWDRAQYYNRLSHKVLGREVAHNLLLHHNPLNAYFLSDLISMFKKKGWKVIDADNAFLDPAYKLEPKILPAGESLLWGLAKQSGKFESELRYPGEDGEYQKEEMDRLGL